MRAGNKYKDSWGCIWESSEDGITGVVTEHPLASWDNFSSYEIPDAQKQQGMKAVDWEEIKQHFAALKSQNKLCMAGLPHGHTFLRLCDIRGYQNLMYDMFDDNPKLHELIKMIEDFNLAVIENYLNCGAEIIRLPEDLGMQKGPMLSPAHFEKYILPVYNKMFKKIRDAGAIIHFHSDGDLHDLVNYFVSSIDAINLQDQVNGIDWIAANLKGRVCIDLDIDRQDVTRFGSPKQIDDLIKKEVEMLADASGGLTMIYGLYPGVSLENVNALMAAMEKYAKSV
jgi:uroporphyrinogen decarboxylase